MTGHSSINYQRLSFAGLQGAGADPSWHRATSGQVTSSNKRRYIETLKFTSMGILESSCNLTSLSLDWRGWSTQRNPMQRQERHANPHRKAGIKPKTFLFVRPQWASENHRTMWKSCHRNNYRYSKLLHTHYAGYCSCQCWIIITNLLSSCSGCYF